MDIGFLGLGNMGAPIAANLLRAGHQVTAWNRTPAKAEALRPQGAKVASDIADAARHEVVCTMVADDRALQDIVDGGLLDAMPKGAVHVSLSTISVAMAGEMHRRHAERGLAFLAAPVFGRPEAAVSHQLVIVAAGDAAAIETCGPLFAAIGRQTFPMGDDPVTAAVVKISGNFLIASVIESLGEALALVRCYGLDPQQYVDFLTSTLFTAPVYKGYGGVIAAEKYEPAGFRITLALKDVRLALAAGEAKGAPLPLASLVRDHILATISRHGDHVDWSAIAKLSAENAGLK